VDIIKFAKLKKMAGGSSGGSSGGGGSSSLFVKLLADELTEITENDLKDVTKLERNCLYMKTNLMKLSIPANVEMVGQYMVNGCSNLVEVVTKAKTYMNQAFTGSGIKKATIYSEEIKNTPFPSCSYLEEIELKDTVKTILGLVESCQKLQNLHIPDSVTTLGSVAVYCTKLRTINIPINAVIKDAAFCYRCHALTDIYFDAKDVGDQSTPSGSSPRYLFTTYSESDATAANAILHIGKTVQRIPKYCFIGHWRYNSSTQYYSLIKDVVFDEDTECTEIGDYAFQSSSKITKIKFPKSLQKIGNYSFYQCSALTTIELQSETPPTLGTRAFCPYSSDTTYLTKIIVPKGTLEAYKSATGWSASTYTNIMEEKIDGTEWNEVVEE